MFIPQVQDSVLVKPEDLQLKPLYEPDKVSFTFETIGWKILAVILAVLLLVSTYLMIKKYIKNAYRRDALKKLDSVKSVSEILILLKMVAIQTFSREEVGTLYGKEWLQFLDNTVNEPLFVPHMEIIEDVVYKNKILAPKEQQLILLNSKKWIRKHAR